MRYVVEVTYGRRRPWVTPPPDGPCTPPRLNADAGRHVVVLDADSDTEATLVAAQMLSHREHKGATNPISDVGDMVTATEILEVEL